MMSKVRFLAMLAILAVATAASANSDGISGRSKVGCGVSGCHGPDDQAAVTIDPLAAGTGYDLTVTVEDNPDDPDPTDNINLGGFNLSASFGRLTPVDSSKVQSFGTREVGHTTAGNDQRTWDVRWEPEGTSLCSLDLAAAANSVNGNGRNDSGDYWGLVSQTLTLDASDDAADPSADILHPASNGLYFQGVRTGNSPPVPTVIGSINLTVEATDDVGIEKVEVLDTDLMGEASLGTMSFDSGNQVFTLNWTTTGSEPPGQHTLTFRITDCAGNVTEVSRDVLVL